MNLKDFLYKHRRFVIGCIAAFILVVILASCQGLANVNGNDNVMVLSEVF